MARHWRVVAGVLSLASLLLVPRFASADGVDAERLLAQVRNADTRFGAIGYRLATANAALCDRLEPGLGMQIHTIDQYSPVYRAAARRLFGFETGAAVEGVFLNGPAAAAGVFSDESIVSIGPIKVAAPIPDSDAASTSRLIALHAGIGDLPPGSPLQLTLTSKKRGARSVTLLPTPACYSRFELALEPSFEAQADGTMVQLSVRFLEEYRDEEVAVIVAHELAHNILRHRARLEAQGVAWGMLAGIGGNVKYFRQTEIEADLLGVHLLANAGYDPRGAAAFWRKFGPRNAGGLLRARTHPHWRDRVATLEVEASRIEASGNRQSRPKVLADRDKPLTGDWQSLLVSQR